MRDLLHRSAIAITLMLLFLSAQGIAAPTKKCVVCGPGKSPCVIVKHCPKKEKHS